MASFSQFGNHIYILLAINYVSKWVEIISFLKNDVITVSKVLKNNTFSGLRTLRVFIRDEKFHFIDHTIGKLLVKYNIIHKVPTAYHLQTNGQTKVSNKEIKNILEKVVNLSYKDWTDHLDSTL